MIKKTIFLVLGIILVIIGIAGIFLPILQGILLIIAGLFLIGEYKYIKFIEDTKKYIRNKHRRKHL
ncbi:MAG: hypothetical protein ISS25_04765 [Nanoarchaeota archaeon]|nr:hypothetical protein [DPANN group archaeon]MBL7117112.1 hypothetical protein [Nanoarchaeota archaeon]